jgi:hypothetical protein
MWCFYTRAYTGTVKMPFEKLMELVSDLPAADHQLTLGQLSERWGEPATRIADAIDAVRVAAGERTYITVTASNQVAKQDTSSFNVVSLHR